jgi:hypothetical protein
MHIFSQFFKGEFQPPIAIRTDIAARKWFTTFVEENCGEDHGIDLQSDNVVDIVNQRLINREIYWTKTTCI